MKKIFTLLFNIIILLTLTSCGKTVDTPQNLSEMPSGAQQIEATPATGTASSLVAEFQPDGNGENSVKTPAIPTNTLEKAEPDISENLIATTAWTTEITYVPTSAPISAPTSVPTPAPTSVPTLAPTSVPSEQTLEPMPAGTQMPIPSPPAFETTQTSISTLRSSVTIINITVGNSVFPVKLYDNDAAKALSALLPLNLNMSELNGNEKYYYLPDKFPADFEFIGNINAGDLMLYGSDCLVLFYESFSTSYSYTKLGYVEDASDLAAALGNGSIEIVISELRSFTD